MNKYLEKIAEMSKEDKARFKKDARIKQNLGIED